MDSVFLFCMLFMNKRTRLWMISNSDWYAGGPVRSKVHKGTLYRKSTFFETSSALNFIDSKVISTQISHIESFYFSFTIALSTQYILLISKICKHLMQVNSVHSLSWRSLPFFLFHLSVWVSSSQEIDGRFSLLSVICNHVLISAFLQSWSSLSVSEKCRRQRRDCRRLNLIYFDTFVNSTKAFVLAEAALDQ